MPGLRRLRRARRRPVVPAHARDPAREHGLRLRASAARSRFPYYLDTYGMHSIHGRAPAIATGLAVPAPGPVGVGRHRRRRRAVDRRQPPDPRAAPQRQPQDPAVQQPDLRADQGPVLADVRGRARSPSPRRWARSTTPFNPISLALGAEATFVGAGAGLRPQGPHRGAARRRRAPRRRRSSRSSRTARSSTTAPSTCCARATRPRRGVIPLTHGEPIRFGPAGDDGLGSFAVVQDGFRLRVAKADEVDAAQIVVHDAADHDAGLRAVAAVGPGPRPTPSRGSSATSSARPTTTRPAPRSQQAVDSAQTRGGADLQALLRGRDTWTVVG